MTHAEDTITGKGYQELTPVGNSRVSWKTGTQRPRKWHVEEELTLQRLAWWRDERWLCREKSDQEEVEGGLYSQARLNSFLFWLFFFLKEKNGSRVWHSFVSSLPGTVPCSSATVTVSTAQPSWALYLILKWVSSSPVFTSQYILWPVWLNGFVCLGEAKTDSTRLQSQEHWITREKNQNNIFNRLSWKPALWVKMFGAREDPGTCFSDSKTFLRSSPSESCFYQSGSHDHL